MLAILQIVYNALAQKQAGAKEISYRVVFREGGGLESC
tara:strand:- start:435 stop:548 length:114 start_codon:yes stop_codon:yes gene_type:complete